MPKTAIPTIIEPRGLPVPPMPAPDGATIVEGQQTIIEPDAPGAAAPTVDASMFVPVPGATFREWILIEPIVATSAEADIWRLKHRDSKTRAVLKLYRYGIQPKPEILAAVKQLKAESVVRVLEYGETQGRHFEIQEFAAHGTLGDIIDNDSVGEIPAVEVLRELHSALKDVHDCGIIHRDLKPANIFIRTLEPTDLILADFGISSLSDLSLHLSNTNRTASYAAPEAMTGVIAKASDWWSIGVILIEILTGKHPFDGLDERTINFALVSRGISIPTGIDSEWLMLLKGLLTRDHGKRWGADEVGRWLGGDRNIPVHYIDGVAGGPGGGAAPYKFAGKEFHELHSLALAMAEHWDDAAKRVSRGSLQEWVTVYLGDADLANQLQDVAEDPQLDEDQKVCACLLAMDRSLPMVWRGEVVTPEWIALKVDVEDLPTLRMSADTFSENHDTYGDDDDIELIRRSIELIRDEQYASTTLLQNRLGIKIGKANQILEELHERNIVGPQKGGLTRDVFIGREDGFSLAVRFLESSLPNWLRRLREEDWLAKLADEHRDAWRYLRECKLPVSRTTVDQLILSPHRDAVWPLLEERRQRYRCATHEKVEELFASGEQISRLDAIAVVATDESHFKTHTDAELGEYLLWLDKAGIHYSRMEAEEIIRNPDPEQIATRAQEVRDSYVEAYPPALHDLLTKDPLEFIEAVGLIVAQRDHFETHLQAWVKSAHHWNELARKLRVQTRKFTLSTFNMSMREVRTDCARWKAPRKELKEQLDLVIARHKEIFANDSLGVDTAERSDAARMGSDLITAAAELDQYFEKRARSAKRTVYIMRTTMGSIALGGMVLLGLGAIQFFVS